MKFAVNISTVFTEVPFIERFKLAREHGFTYVECQFPYSCSVNEIKEQLSIHNQSLVLMNLPPGNWEKGDRGLTADPNKIDQFKKSVEIGLVYATALNVPNIHCMAGNVLIGEDQGKVTETYLRNLQYALEQVAPYNKKLLIEPINRDDMPGYLLANVNKAVNIIQQLNNPNLKLQFDFYHVQKIQGNLLQTFKQYFDLVGHVQIADVPGRHEPGTGEIHYRNIFAALRKLNYKGFIGLEYTPLEASEASFAWLEEGDHK